MKMIKITEEPLEKCTGKRKFIKIPTCKIGIKNTPEDVSNQLIMLAKIGRLAEVNKHFVRLFDIDGQFLANTTLSLQEVIDLMQNPLEIEI